MTQSNWTSTDSGSDAYILNKPTIPTEIEIKAESVQNGLFLDNTGNYTSPLKVPVQDTLGWDLTWELPWNSKTRDYDTLAEAFYRHEHDTQYYTKSQIDSYNTEHDTQYYTKGQIDSYNTNYSEHLHDTRYYTKGQIDSTITGIQASFTEDILHHYELKCKII